MISIGAQKEFPQPGVLTFALRAGDDAIAIGIQSEEYDGRLRGSLVREKFDRAQAAVSVAIELL
jgi:hypothetical protein